MSAKQYVAWLATSVVTLALASILFTVLVDPYRAFGTPTIRGWTELKPRIYQEAAMAKVYQLERVRPRTILLGNSRVEIGIDPVSPVWPADAGPVFNAAEEGKDLRTALIMLREAISLGNLRMAVVGVDFQDFLQSSYSAVTELPPPGPDERRLRVDRHGDPNSGRTAQVWRDWLTSTLSLDAVRDSFQTVMDQNADTTATMTVLGFNPLHEYRLFAERNGYFELFAHARRRYAQQYAAYMVPDFADPSGIRNYFYLQMIIDLARAHRIRLILFTPPYHAQYLEMLHRLGLWPSFLEWMRSLALIADTARRDGANLAVFDCSTYDSITTEQIPPAGDRTSKMRWYWEPGHFKSSLGDQVLKALFGASTDLCSSLDRRDVRNLESLAPPEERNSSSAKAKADRRATSIGRVIPF
jgi:hypothetical protein